LLQDAGADHWHLPIALTKFTALGIGMGLGQHADTRKILLETLADCRIPLLLDADALQLLRQEEATQLLPAGTVLTPHLKEFDRLFGAQADWWSRLARAQALSEAHGWVIVLKNANTFVVAPGGKLYINLSGNPGLAKGGSGDVALLAQGLQPLPAARLGVWLHGQAADLALATQHENSLLASDVIAHLGAAFRSLDAAT
jgi:NAD(P)H-hydrate epimerase